MEDEFGLAVTWRSVADKAKLGAFVDRFEFISEWRKVCR